MMSSQSVALATAMAVSGTVVLLALRLQKPPSSTPHHFPLPPSCIISSGRRNEKRKKKKKKKKKKVQFAEDVVDPTGNSEEYRKSHKNITPNLNKYYSNSNTTTPTTSTASKTKKGRKVEEMPANRMALYNGILRDRVGPYS